MVELISIITGKDPSNRDQSLESACAGLSVEELWQQCAALESFRARSENLYERVRALFFLYAIHRFHLPQKLVASARTSGYGARSLIPFAGYAHLLQRRFEEAIAHFQAVQQLEGPSDALSSALAAAYHRLAFQTLADQVRRSVRCVRGNQWMFRMGHPANQPLRLRPELLQRHPSDGTYPILRESTAVRMDLTHCGWSDIFFLGMDFPEGAKVLNVSIDLGVHGRDAAPKPPIETYLRVIEEPLLRLVSVDLGAAADLTHLADVFDFAKDYLGLLKAAVIASGLVPPGVEGSGQSLAELLAHMVGPGRGLGIVSSVNDIPKGSRLAVSTNLLASLVSLCMRATRQAASLDWPIAGTRAAARSGPGAAGRMARRLGRWLAGFRRGLARNETHRRRPFERGRPGIRGQPRAGSCPQHRVLEDTRFPPIPAAGCRIVWSWSTAAWRKTSGPILEMVTEKYLLRSAAEWQARKSMLGILEEILSALRAGNVQAIGAGHHAEFFRPDPNHHSLGLESFHREQSSSESAPSSAQAFWGFWMLGGMSGGGMGFIFAPEKKVVAQQRLQEIMSQTKRELEHALPICHGTGGL